MPPLYRPTRATRQLEPATRKQEDAICADPDLASLSLKDKIATRPAYGQRGTSMNILANYIEIAPKKDRSFHLYSISVKPDIVGKKRAHVVRLFLEQEFASRVSQKSLATDFKSKVITCDVIYSPEAKQVEVKDGDGHTTTGYGTDVQFKNKYDDSATPIYTVALCPLIILPINHLLAYMSSNDKDITLPKSQEWMQTLNILLNYHSMTQPNQIMVGKRVFQQLVQAVNDIGGGLMAQRGFYSSVRLATGRLLVNVNLAHGAFYQPILLSNLMMKFADECGRDIPTLERFVKGLQVRFRHLPRKTNGEGLPIDKISRISGLASRSDGLKQSNPPKVEMFGAKPGQVQFFMDNKFRARASLTLFGDVACEQDGAYISVLEYFTRKYPASKIENVVPLVNAGSSKNPNYLPADVCEVLPGQITTDKLTSSQTTKMIDFAVKDPISTISHIEQEGFRMLGLSPPQEGGQGANATAEKFGIGIMPNLLNIPARLLPPPSIQYSAPQKIDLPESKWDLRTAKMTRCPANATFKWKCAALLYPGKYGLEPSEQYTQIKKAMDAFVTKMKTHNMNVPKYTTMTWSYINDKNMPLENHFRMKDPKSGETSMYNGEMIMFILPARHVSTYNRIKYLGDVSYGFNTMCVLQDRLLKLAGQQQYFSNVALKFNLKLGGTNQMIHVAPNNRPGGTMQKKPLDAMEVITENNTMVVGIDVTHPSLGSSDTAPSIAAMVASVDKHLGQWPAILRVQRFAKNEMVEALTEMLASRIQLWKKRHGAAPRNILVYRDGVSEGQYNTVLKTEVSQLLAACKLEPTPPRLTVVVVGKRHHTRFFPTTNDSADKNGNPRPGTIVDRGITDARNWDFFLQSHSAIQGTARPAHYFVIVDEIFRGLYGRKNALLPPGCRNAADVLEAVTQSLCYVYGRATRSVSIVTPAYYADLACDRARCYLQRYFAPVDMRAQREMTGAERDVVVKKALWEQAKLIKIHENIANSMFYI